MSAPFSFQMPAGAAAFSMGVAASAAASAAPPQQAAPPSAAAPPAPAHVPAVLRADVFPANLQSPSLPPAPLLLVTPALHPFKGRVLLATVARQPGDPLLLESAVVASNWDHYRCAHCDKPHATKRCPGAKKIWAKKIVAHMDEVEASITEATSIGSLDHARSFLKLLHRYFAECVLGTGDNRGPLADLLALSSSREAECAASLVARLPRQSSSAKEILDDVGAWPPELSVAQAGRILAILNTNSHELSDIRGSGVFLRASLMEHTCIAPNCNFSTTQRELQILALRPIEAGENLSIDYGMGLYRPVSERRRALMKSHGFRCFCVQCTTRPDKARAFSCPAVASAAASSSSAASASAGGLCCGVIYPVGPDDKAEELVAWGKLVAEGQAFMAAQAAAHAAAGAPQVLPLQSVPVSYPAPTYTPWSCNACGYVLSAPQIAQCLAREKEAAKALRHYRDEDDDEPEPEMHFDFDKKQKHRRSAAGAAGADQDEDGDEDLHDDDEEEDDEDEDDEDEEGDEILNPDALITRLVSQARPSLHPSHHTFFWSWDFYARSCSSDSDFAAEAVPIFQQLLSWIQSYLSPDLAWHDALMIYSDYLAQVFVVLGRIDEARGAFGQALGVCQKINGAGHHSSRELAEMVQHTPECAEELQSMYASFQASLESLIYDTKKQQAREEARAKRRAKAGAAGGKKSKGKIRRGEAHSDDESEASDEGAGDEPEGDAALAVTAANQALILAQMEALMIARAEAAEQARAREQAQNKDGEGDDDMTKGGAGKKKKKTKKGGKK